MYFGEVVQPDSSLKTYTPSIFSSSSRDLSSSSTAKLPMWGSLPPRKEIPEFICRVTVEDVKKTSPPLLPPASFFRTLITFFSNSSLVAIFLVVC